MFLFIFFNSEMIRKPVYSINASKKKRVQDDDGGADAIEQLKALMGGGGESEKERNHIYFYGDVCSCFLLKNPYGSQRLQWPWLLV